MSLVYCSDKYNVPRGTMESEIMGKMFESFAETMYSNLGLQTISLGEAGWLVCKTFMSNKNVPVLVAIGDEQITLFQNKNGEYACHVNDLEFDKTGEFWMGQIVLAELEYNHDIEMDLIDKIHFDQMGIFSIDIQIEILQLQLSYARLAYNYFLQRGVTSNG